MMSRGQRFISINFITASPALTQSLTLSLEIAAWAELLGRLMPIASIAEAIVFAVYMPPHDPAPGMERDSICSSSLAVI